MPQDPPNTIKIELTEGCNLRCGMCGIQGIRERAGGPYKFMTVARAETIVEMLAATGWRSKFEFALRGEPLMNPDAAAIMAVVRKHFPRAHIMLTSNALPMLKPPGVHARIRELFAAGLNVLALDNYKNSRKAIEQAVTFPDVPATAYGSITDLPIFAGPSPYEKVDAKTKRLIIIEDFETAALADREVGTKHVNYHCGAGSEPKEVPQQRCARPFREMVIRWDGGIALCCNEWRDELEMGVLPDYETAVDAWNNAVLHAMRKKLYAGERTESPCSKCNERTYRNGLLPDKKGQQTMEPFTEEDADEIRKARNAGPRTRPVLRNWEMT